MYDFELTTNGGPPRAVSIGDPDVNGDFPVLHVPSFQSIATKYDRPTAEALCAELNALVVPFDEETCCDRCYLGWELINDDGTNETFAPCQACGGEISLGHLRNEAVRLRIEGAVI
jgi:hypothetical protein